MNQRPKNCSENLRSSKLVNYSTLTNRRKEQEMKASTVIMVVILTITMLLAGCVEPQKTDSKVWGKGDLPEEYRSWFGNDNQARLIYVETKMIERLQRDIYGTTQNDKSGKPVRTPGLVDRVAALEKNQPYDVNEADIIMQNNSKVK